MQIHLLMQTTNESILRYKKQIRLQKKTLNKKQMILERFFTHPKIQF
jgi:hypothetical protein